MGIHRNGLKWYEGANILQCLICCIYTVKNVLYFIQLPASNADVLSIPQHGAEHRAKNFSDVAKSVLH